MDNSCGEICFKIAEQRLRKAVIIFRWGYALRLNQAIVEAAKKTAVKKATNAKEPVKEAPATKSKPAAKKAEVKKATAEPKKATGKAKKAAVK